MGMFLPMFACDFTSSALPWLQQLQRNPGEVLQIPPKLSAENKVVFECGRITVL